MFLRVPQHRQVLQWSLCKFQLASKLPFSLHPQTQFLSLLCNPDFTPLSSSGVWYNSHWIPVHPKREVFAHSISWTRVSRGAPGWGGREGKGWCLGKSGSLMLQQNWLHGSAPNSLLWPLHVHRTGQMHFQLTHKANSKTETWYI